MPTKPQSRPRAMTPSERQAARRARLAGSIAQISTEIDADLKAAFDRWRADQPGTMREQLERIIAEAIKRKPADPNAMMGLYQ